MSWKDVVMDAPKPSPLDAPLPSKPSPQHTKLITCIDCGAKRWVKPQDVFQVKRCRSCQEAKKGGKGLARLAVVKAKCQAKKAMPQEVRRYCPRLYVIRYHWTDSDAVKMPRHRRIWP